MNEREKGFRSEAEFRQEAGRFFDALEGALESVDPDRVETDRSGGALTLTFSGKSKCILSLQPSVQQIWVAVASRGIALHFDWVRKERTWRDDKTGQSELFSLIGGILKSECQIELQFQGVLK